MDAVRNTLLEWSLSAYPDRAGCGSPCSDVSHSVSDGIGAALASRSHRGDAAPLPHLHHFDEDVEGHGSLRTSLRGASLRAGAVSVTRQLCASGSGHLSLYQTRWSASRCRHSSTAVVSGSAHSMYRCGSDEEERHHLRDCLRSVMAASPHSRTSRRHALDRANDTTAVDMDGATDAELVAVYASSDSGNTPDLRRLRSGDEAESDTGRRSASTSSTRGGRRRHIPSAQRLQNNGQQQQEEQHLGAPRGAPHVLSMAALQAHVHAMEQQSPQTADYVAAHVAAVTVAGVVGVAPPLQDNADTRRRTRQSLAPLMDAQLLADTAAGIARNQAVRASPLQFAAVVPENSDGAGDVNVPAVSTATGTLRSSSGVLHPHRTRSYGSVVDSSCHISVRFSVPSATATTTTTTATAGAATTTTNTSKSLIDTQMVPQQRQRAMAAAAAALFCNLSLKSDDHALGVAADMHAVHSAEEKSTSRGGGGGAWPQRASHASAAAVRRRPLLVPQTRLSVADIQGDGVLLRAERHRNPHTSPTTNTAAEPRARPQPPYPLLGRVSGGGANGVGSWRASSHMCLAAESAVPRSFDGDGDARHSRTAPPLGLCAVPQPFGAYPYQWLQQSDPLLCGGGGGSSSSCGCCGSHETHGWHPSSPNGAAFPSEGVTSTGAQPLPPLSAHTYTHVHTSLSPSR
ncbi:hypothetical protein NESM_000483900 [Novymonas esmeraldas]|uniref:Uncharacterized protein n=1 Tax=Novymonas esmeraldas TaxID=1808958 RepID=A0AAW0EPI4_9TRYP